MTKLCFYHLPGAMPEGGVNLHLREPKHAALATLLAKHPRATFGIVSDLRITKGSRGRVCTVQQLWQEDDGSFGLEASIGDEFIIEECHEKHRTQGLVHGTVRINSYGELPERGLDKAQVVDFLHSWPATETMLQHAYKAAEAMLEAGQTEQGYYRCVSAIVATLQMRHIEVLEDAVKKSKQLPHKEGTEILLKAIAVAVCNGPEAAVVKSRQRRDSKFGPTGMFAAGSVGAAVQFQQRAVPVREPEPQARKKPSGILSVSREPVKLLAASREWVLIEGCVLDLKCTVTRISADHVAQLCLVPEPNDSVVVRDENGCPSLFPRVWLQVQIQGNVFHVLGAVGGTVPLLVGADILDCLFEKGYCIGAGQAR